MFSCMQILNKYTTQFIRYVRCFSDSIGSVTNKNYFVILIKLTIFICNDWLKIMILGRFLPILSGYTNEKEND